MKGRFGLIGHTYFPVKIFFDRNLLNPTVSNKVMCRQWISCGTFLYLLASSCMRRFAIISEQAPLPTRSYLKLVHSEACRSHVLFQSPPICLQ